MHGKSAANTAKAAVPVPRVDERVRTQLSEKEISDLTFVIVAINCWNRISIGFKNVPGSADAKYGLTKAGLN